MKKSGKDADLGKRKDSEIAAELDAHMEKKRKEDGLPELKVGKSKEISADELLQADQFCPSALPFSLSWEGFHQLKEFYHLTDMETTTILLAMIGPKEAGRKYWSQYKVPLDMFNENGVLQVPKDPTPPQVAPADASKLDKNMANKLQLALPAAPLAKRKHSDVEEAETDSTATTAALEGAPVNVNKKVKNPDAKWKQFAVPVRPPPEDLDVNSSTSSEEEPPPRKLPASTEELEMQIEEDEPGVTAPTDPVTLMDQARFAEKIGLGFFRFQFLCDLKCLEISFHKASSPTGIQRFEILVWICNIFLLGIPSSCFLKTFFGGWPGRSLLSGLAKLWHWRQKRSASKPQGPRNSLVLTMVALRILPSSSKFFLCILFLTLGGSVF